MPVYRVKPGFRHGAFNQYAPGDKVTLTEEEARGFLDKLEKVGDGEFIFRVGNDSLAIPEGVPLRVKEPSKPKGKEPSKPPAPTGNPEPFDVAGATPEDVVDAVNGGKLTASDALIAEQQGRKRAGLIEQLTQLAEPQSKPE